MITYSRNVTKIGPQSYIQLQAEISNFDVFYFFQWINIFLDNAVYK